MGRRTAVIERTWLGGAGVPLALGAVACAVMVLAGLLVVRTSPRAEARFEMGDGAAWLPSAAVGGVSLLDGASGSVVTSLAVATPGDDYAVVEWGADALVVNRSAGTVGRLDGATWAIETGLVKFSDGNTPLDVVANRDVGWLVRPGAVAPLNLENLETRDPMPVSASYGDGVVDASGALLYASADPTTPVQRIGLDGTMAPLDDLAGPVSFADLGGEVAAVDVAGRSVWLEGAGTICDELQLPTDAEIGVAGADGSLLVVADTGGILAWQPGERGCPEADDFLTVEPAHFATPAVTDGWAAIVDLDRSEVLVVDLVTARLVARASLQGVAAGSPVDLHAENGLVWFNDRASDAAGLIRRDGTVESVVKYDVGGDGDLVAAPVVDGDDDIEVAGIQTDRPGEGDGDPAAPTTTPTTAPTGDDGSATTSTTTPIDPQPSTPTTADPDQPVVTGSDVLEPEVTVDPPVSPTTSEPGDPDEPDPSSSTTSTTVLASPVEVRLAATAAEVAVGDPVTFQAIVDNGAPTFFDFSTSPGNAQADPATQAGFITYRFPAAGRYLVSVEACDADDNCDSATIALDVVAGAVEHRAIIADPGIVTAGVPVQLASVSQGDGIQEYRWNFGAGASPSSGNGETPTVEWSTPGTKTVTLTIAGNGCAPEQDCATVVNDLDSVTRQITVVEQAPPYAINVSGPTSVEAGQSVTYVASTSNAAGLPSPHWNVQGTSDLTNRGAEVDVSWSTPGTYVVQISTDDGANRGEGQTTVTVTAPVEPASLAITCSPTSLTAGDTAQCQVTDATNVSGASWQVSFPNPGQGSRSGGSITYDAAGTVTVRRVATHGVTGDPVTSNTVNLVFAEGGPAPVDPPSISLSGPAARDTGQGGTWNLSNSGGPIDSVSWSSDAGGSMNVAGDQRSASKTFGNPGTYTITATADGPGGSDTATFTVTVSEPEPTVTMSLGCDASTLDVGTYAHCGVVGDAALFSGYSWSITQPDPAEYSSWSSGPGYMDVVSFVPGQVRLTLTATHVASGQPVTSNTVTVNYAAPPADPAPAISISGPTMVETGQAATYSFTNSGGTITSIEWQAGGQSPGSGQNYTVTWNSATQVTLAVTVTGPGGTSTDSLVVTINDPAPPPAEPPPAEPGGTVNPGITVPGPTTLPLPSSTLPPISDPAG